MIPLDQLLPNDQVIRVFPARNQWTPQDQMAFVGDPPLFRPGTRKTPVRVSVTFTWHKARAEKIAEAWASFYDDVKIGGPAYRDPGGEFMPGRFLKLGCTITSRGCPKRCGWCVVPNNEGELRELQIKPGWIVQDNNLLACSDRHLKAVFQMLQNQHRRIYFNGGLDKHFLKPWHRELFDSILIGELWFACDTTSDLPWLEKAARVLEGIPLRKRRCYAMIGYDNETVAEAQRRIEQIFQLGFMPFCQLYQPDETKVYPLEWRQIRRKWSRPAAYMPRCSSAA
jgi:hypothetical protein